MSGKNLIMCLMAAVLTGAVPHSVMAFDIAGCLDTYAKEHNIKYDLEKPDTMIRPIIYCHTVTGAGAESAIEAEETINNIINGYATELYGEAISVRAQMMEDSKSGSAKKLAKKALSSFMAKDKKSVVQDKVAPNYKDIAKNISKIIELEARIANLEAARLISQERDGAELFEEEDEE
ncbi:MAG: hypothetical protein KHX55_01380 [Proteobacteria bacterium]|nr:hypothetical protein [Pseudomonadota bacterium]